MSAIDTAVKFKWYDFNTFDEKEYNDLKNFSKGDINVIVPREVIAFSSPISPHLNLTNEISFNKPEALLNQFQQLQINTICRFNEKLYEESVFTNNGLSFFDLFFEDGQAPPFELVSHFKELCKGIRTGIGFHCKAGMGRTGTMIVIYLNERFGVKVKEAVAWVKMCRPGSINRIQYEYLVKYDNSKGKTVRREDSLQTTLNFKQIDQRDRSQSINITRPIRGLIKESDQLPSFFDPVQKCVPNENFNFNPRSRSATPQTISHMRRISGFDNNKQMPAFTSVKSSYKNEVNNKRFHTPVRMDKNLPETYGNYIFNGHNGLRSEIVGNREKEKLYYLNVNKNFQNIQPFNRGQMISYTQKKIPHKETLKQFYPQNQNTPVSYYPTKENPILSFNMPIKHINQGFFNEYCLNVVEPTKNQTPESLNRCFKNVYDNMNQDARSIKLESGKKNDNYRMIIEDLDKHGHSLPPRAQDNPLKQKWL